MLLLKGHLQFVYIQCKKLWEMQNAGTPLVTHILSLASCSKKQLQSLSNNHRTKWTIWGNSEIWAVMDFVINLLQNIDDLLYSLVFIPFLTLIKHTSELKICQNWFLYNNKSTCPDRLDYFFLSLAPQSLEVGTYLYQRVDNIILKILTLT